MGKRRSASSLTAIRNSNQANTTLKLKPSQHDLKRLLFKSEHRLHDHSENPHLVNYLWSLLSNGGISSISKTQKMIISANRKQSRILHPRKNLTTSQKKPNNIQEIWQHLRRNLTSQKEPTNIPEET